MILKPLEPSFKLKYYQALLHRTHLTTQQQSDYQTCLSGYQGEQTFLNMIQPFKEILIICDINMISAIGEAQFDFLVIFNQTITHFDVKNYKGTYRIEDGAFKNQYNNNVKNPDIQLSRAHNILQNIIHPYYPHIKIHSYNVFINDQYFFKGDTNNEKWIFRSMLNHYLKQYQKQNIFPEEDFHLATFILKNQAEQSHYQQPVKTPFHWDMKGLKCPTCLNSIQLLERNKNTYTCNHCHTKHTVKSIIKHNLKELYILKGDAFTTKEATKWCEHIPLRTLQRVLNACFINQSSYKGSKYLPK